MRLILSLTSRLCGFFFGISWPHPINLLVLRFLARAFGINCEESSLPLSAYSSFESFFTRSLKPGLRPLAEGIISPSDGVLSRSEPVIEGRCVQVKGITYSPFDLVYGSKATSNASFKPFWVSTVYLAPHNYHKVHAPLDGVLESIAYMRGELWPVNPKFLGFIPNLFVRNERLVFHMRHRESGGAFKIVMVGALNVGKMSTPFLPGFFANKGLSSQMFAGLERYVQKGEELGTFHLGSTVVIVFDEKTAAFCKLVQSLAPQSILMGSTLPTQL